MSESESDISAIVEARLLPLADDLWTRLEEAEITLSDDQFDVVIASLRRAASTGVQIGAAETLGMVADHFRAQDPPIHFAPHLFVIDVG